MPMPEGSQLSRGYSPILTGMAVSYLPSFAPKPNGFGGFIAPLVFPTVRVGAKTGTYNKWGRGDFLRLEAKKLANAEPAPIGGFKTTFDTFYTEHYGIAANWTAEDLAEARIGGISEASLIAAKNLYVTGQCLLRKEVNVAALIQTAGNWSQTYTGVAANPVAQQFVKWDLIGAVPVDDVIAISQSMADASGFRPNTMIIPRLVWNKMRSNPSLIDRIKYGGTMDRPTEVTLSQLKGLFEIENIYVPDQQYNTGAEGLADVFTNIWNNNVWIGYVAPLPVIGANPDKQQPSAGYGFSWDGGVGEGIPGGAGVGPESFDAVRNPEGIFIRNYQTVRPAAKYVEAEMWWQANVTGADVGITLTNVIG